MDADLFAFKVQVIGPNELQVLGTTLLLSACWFVFWRFLLKRALKLPIVAGGFGALLGISRTSSICPPPSPSEAAKSNGGSPPGGENPRGSP